MDKDTVHLSGGESNGADAAVATLSGPALTILGSAGHHRIWRAASMR